MSTNLKLSKRAQKDMITVVYGNNPLEYQYTNITDDIYYISNNCDIKVRNFANLWETILEKDSRFHNIKYRYELKQLLYPYMIYFRKISVDKCPISFVSHSKYSSRINGLFDYIDNFRNPNEPRHISYGKCIDVSKEDIKNCDKALNILLYYNNLKLKPFILESIKANSVKLHDKKLDNINEYNEILSQTNINIMWLREDKGI